MFSKVVYTLGHSNRSIQEFIAILEKFHIERVVDVRRWPSSKFKHFEKSQLEAILKERSIDYVWIPQLGGYRKFGVDVPEVFQNYATCFKSRGFRAYAAYITLREDVKQYLELLERLVLEKTSVLLCSEKLYTKCHRKILADYLCARGFKILHIIDEQTLVEHRLSKCARIVNGHLTYV